MVVIFVFDSIYIVAPDEILNNVIQFSYKLFGIMVDIMVSVFDEWGFIIFSPRTHKKYFASFLVVNNAGYNNFKIS